MLRTSSQVLSRLCAHQIRVTASSWSQRNSRRFHDEFTTPDSLDKKARVPNAIGNKFKQFVDKDAPIILDVNEERQRIRTGLEEDNQPSEPYLDMNLERGKTGVFEIEELVEILKRDNAENIFVCAVPEEYKYVDYICVTTGRSTRHMIALAEFVRKMYKLKRNNDDILPKIEGRTSKDWMALDLGNIALHIFSEDARDLYDLESLWSVGAEYDKEYNKPEDEMMEIYEKHSIYLHDLTPKSSI